MFNEGGIVQVADIHNRKSAVAQSGDHHGIFRHYPIGIAGRLDGRHVAHPFQVLDVIYLHSGGVIGHIGVFSVDMGIVLHHHWAERRSGGDF